VVTQPPLEVYWFLFKNGGWLILLLVFYKMFIVLYHLNRTGLFLSKLKWIHLAVDVPKGNEQTPKAVEHIFSQLAGAHKNPDLEEELWDGYSQPWFSFEIISIEGYVQFVVTCPEKHRDLVEAAVYAQYPEAEITEIEDYAKDFPHKFPDPVYGAWGTEYVLIKRKTIADECYPIRTYKEFEHPGAEDVFKDPLAALLEIYSRLGPGEFAGIQILAKPISDSWRNWSKAGAKLVQKLIGAPEKSKSTILGKIGSLPSALLDTTAQAITGAETIGPSVADKKDAPPSLMLHLSPNTKTVIEKVEQKLSKISYATKIRFIYIGKKQGGFNKNKVVYAVTGAIKQFITHDCNGLKPEMATIGSSPHYFFKTARSAWRQTRLVNAYRNRSRWKGAPEYLMNIEELATVWHFPMLTVKAPLLAKTESRRAQPPTSLPVERSESTIKPIEQKGKMAPPPNLPVI
jgi:hypothetical protein